MTRAQIQCGFIPLVDCAPLVVAREIGFAEEEGLDLILHKEKSWSAVRDRLALGHHEAAHLLSPVPIAMSLGLGGMPTRLDALSVLSVNGDVVGVSRDLADTMRQTAELRDFMDAEAVGRALIAASGRRLRIGVPFPFSMHAELLYYWLGALGMEVPKELDVRTVPPPLMADAVASGDIDAFCVGEPWGSIAVEAGVAELILPGCAIWGFAPEKVLAVRHDWAEDQPDLAGRLIRTLWRSARWLADPSHRITVSELLAMPAYVDVPADIIDRALTGRLLLTPTGEERLVPRFLEFFDGAATFPWRSQAAWIAERLAARMGLDRAEAADLARQCFRPDLYRASLAPIGVDLPGASEKVEGALDIRAPVASSTGEMFLGPDRFFDHQVFDPAPRNHPQGMPKN
jgi:NitT/TauT family transport system ATP-binding protein